MFFRELASATRSVRRFNESAPVSREDLLEIIETASLAPCASNLQRLRYSIVTGEREKDQLFRGLGWAGYLADWQGPGEDERPRAYIVISSPADEDRSFTGIDTGIAAAYIVLAARDKGFGCCILLSFSRESVAEIACTSDVRPELVIALGVPGEEIVLDRYSGSVKYYRDSAGRHHVPKIPAAELIVKET
ncbi:MAG: nitroreductase family protein [Candidatus Fermentibacteraceae bacterium]